jgi:uncharacterized sodium:solute symporter family permease YidK
MANSIFSSNCVNICVLLFFTFPVLMYNDVHFIYLFACVCSLRVLVFPRSML